MAELKVSNTLGDEHWILDIRLSESSGLWN